MNQSSSGAEAETVAERHRPNDATEFPVRGVACNGARISLDRAAREQKDNDHDDGEQLVYRGIGR